MDIELVIKSVELALGERIVIRHGPYALLIGVYKDGEISVSGHDYSEKPYNFQLWSETVSAERAELEMQYPPDSPEGGAADV